jgi:hypothetical protein
MESRLPTFLTSRESLSVTNILFSKTAEKLTDDSRSEILENFEDTLVFDPHGRLFIKGSNDTFHVDDGYSFEKMNHTGTINPGIPISAAFKSEPIASFGQLVAFLRSSFIPQRVFSIQLLTKYLDQYHATKEAQTDLHKLVLIKMLHVYRLADTLTGYLSTQRNITLIESTKRCISSLHRAEWTLFYDIQ